VARDVALLRAINVGGRNRVPMADLRELVEGLGCERVATHLQSGNLLFDGAGTAPEEIADGIERGIEARLGLNIRVLVRTRDELAAIVAANPLSELAEDPARHLVTFLSEAPDAQRVDAIDPAFCSPDVFVAHGREIHAWYPDGVRNTKLTNAFWEKRLGVTGTARNWNTVTRLLELADEN
jgi:uncharacterized protein (DUF1697 family)